MKILALIPARGGSKGLPRKNILPLSGKPLIAWSIQAALAAKRIDSVVVSTDDEEIAAISREYGAQVPFMRPTELARDTTPGMDPVFHALDQLTEFTHVLLLQPTSPLRTTEDINQILQLAFTTEANSVVSVCESVQSPYWMYRLGTDGHLNKLIDADDPNLSIARRQDLPPVYVLNGALYFANVRWLRKTKTFFTDETIGYAMPTERSIDIDTSLDLKMAEFLLSTS